jgi:hypothetical protein
MTQPLLFAEKSVRGMIGSRNGLLSGRHRKRANHVAACLNQMVIPCGRDGLKQDMAQAGTKRPMVRQLLSLPRPTPTGGMRFARPLRQGSASPDL